MQRAVRAPGGYSLMLLPITPIPSVEGWALSGYADCRMAVQGSPLSATHSTKGLPVVARGAPPARAPAFVWIVCVMYLGLGSCAAYVLRTTYYYAPSTPILAYQHPTRSLSWSPSENAARAVRVVRGRVPTPGYQPL